MKSIADKAEVSIDFADKTYMGAFGRESAFDIKVGPDDVLLRVVRAGAEKREFAMHLHYHLLADILAEIAVGLTDQPGIEEARLQVLRTAADALAKALKKRRGRPCDLPRTRHRS